MPLEIRLEKISFFYEGHCLFDQLDLILPAGSCTALLGPSGVGKSSLLDLITRVSLENKPLRQGAILTADGSSLIGQVMRLTQQDGLLPWRDVLGNVLIGYELRGNLTAEIRQSALDLLTSFGLMTKDLYKKPRQLSGGMRQRVALIRTVLENKPIWLLDEPFAAVDAITRYQLQNELTQLWTDKTVLLVTHDPLEALRLADYIYVMVGSPAKLRKIIVPKSPLPRTLNAELIDCQNTILAILKESQCS